MKTYYIDYIDNEGDLCHVWVEAFDKNDAKRQVRYEYWDINEIIDCYERN